MKFYKKYIIYISIISVLLLSSCSPIQPTVEKLIKAPKLTGEFYNINKALESEVGSNISLKYPKSGNYKSAFIMHDIDGDNQDEAIVFYAKNDEAKNELKFSVLDKVDNKWVHIFSATAPGVDIEKVLICNIMKYNTDQIVFNWVKANGIDRSLQVYSYENEKFKCIYNKDFLTDVFLFDIDNDSSDELVIIDRTLKYTPNAEIVKKVDRPDNNSELDVISHVRLREGPIDYKKVTLGKLYNNINALFLDAESEERNLEGKSLYTEVIIAPESNLINLFYKTNDYEYNQFLLNQTIRTQYVMCRDINNDSIIEIPKSLPFKNKHIKNSNLEDVKDLIVWKKYNNNQLVFCNLSVENSKDGYSFIYPPNWFSIGYNEITSSTDNDNSINLFNPEIEPLVLAFGNKSQNEITFKSNDEKQQEILTIKVTDSTETLPKNYYEIARKNNFIFYVKINTQKSSLILTLKDVKKCFSMTYGGLN